MAAFQWNREIYSRTTRSKANAEMSSSREEGWGSERSFQLELDNDSLPKEQEKSVTVKNAKMG